MEKVSWFERAIQAMTFADPIPPQADSSLKEIRIVQRDAVGSQGSKTFSGYPNEDYLAELRGHRRAELIDKIRRSDPTVIMLLSSIKNLIKSAVWEVEPGDESEESKADAELIKHILFNDMIDPWDQYLNEALTCIEFGFSVFERTHKIVKDHPKYGSYVGIKSLGWRSPRTIERWNLDQQTGALVSVTQIAYGDLARYVDMDARYLSVITINKEGANYEGISMLRPIYGCYLRKNTYMKLNAIGVEKFAIPTPTLEVPQIDFNSEEYQNAIQVLQDFVGHESQFITYPVGWKLDLVSNTYDPEKVEKSVDAEDRRMVNAFLANFLNLGQSGGGGSYALSNDLSDFFMAGLDYIANLIVQDINRTIIPELIKLNKGTREFYPKVIHSGISDKAGKELSETLKALAESQYIIPDDKLETYIRQKYNLPKASDEGQRKNIQTQVKLTGQATNEPINPQAPATKTVTNPDGTTSDIPIEDVQKSALNGAQVQALVEVLNQVAAQIIPRQSGVEVIVTAFNISRPDAERLVGAAGKGFEPAAPMPSAPGKFSELADNSFYTAIKAAEQLKLAAPKKKAKK